MTKNDKAIQKNYQIDDETMAKIIATTPNDWDEVSQLAYKDYAASQLKGFRDSMYEEVEKMKAKEKKIKEKKYVLCKKMADDKYGGMMFYNNPRNLPESTEEYLKDENVYTISETMYNNSKNIYNIRQNSRATYNAYSSMYGLTRMMIGDTIERCEDFIDCIKQYNKDLAIYAGFVKESLEKALQEIDKTVEQQNKIDYVFDGR